jgi:hypothetical protein
MIKILAIFAMSCSPPSDQGPPVIADQDVKPACSYRSARVGLDLQLDATGVCSSSADFHVSAIAEDRALVAGVVLAHRDCPFSESFSLTIIENVGVYLHVSIVPAGGAQQFECPRRP